MTIEIINLSKSYDKLQVLDDFNLKIEKNKIYCLFGPSGCGKTSLLNILAATLSGDSGKIKGIENLSISYIFQEERLLPWKTVRENIELVIPHDRDDIEKKKYIDQVLKLVKLEDFQDYYPDKLSGGMKQRVSFARAFSYRGDLLIMDEPFKGLHLDLKLELMDAIREYLKKNNSYTVFVSHDIEEAKYIADEIIYLEGPPLRILKIEDNIQKNP